MKTNRSRCAIAILGAAILFAASGQAQQENGPRSGPDTASAAAPSTGVSPDASERERLLLERIDKLERRLALVEAGAAPKAATDPTPAGFVPARTVTLSAQPVEQTKDASQQLPPVVPSPAKVQPAAAPAEAEKAAKPEPFAFADFGWLSGNSRAKESPLQTKAFTGEVRFDTNYVYDFSHPKDHTIGGSSEIFRSGEVQVTQAGVGGDFHWNNVLGRVMTQFGMYSQTTPRNDASTGVGQWNLDGAYRYISEAYGGYHLDVMNGINIEGGIFMSYVGLWSYYQYDNWTYQPSYVSSNTPWFFNGVRVQFFPSDKLKIEPWFINGWQSYGKFNDSPGVGLQVLWRPNGALSVLSNSYYGKDTLGFPGRKRIHSDDSVQVKLLDQPGHFVSKAAASLTFDIGCEYGGGVSCSGGSADRPSQYFVGFMTYGRLWFNDDRYAVTLGGGAINNAGRYLVLLPPINGATALSGTPYFPESPGYQYRAWDYSVTFDYMPRDFVTFRLEFNRRAANVPYFSGPDGITPDGGNTGPPGSVVPGFTPDLRKSESRITGALLVKY
jgi:hypothetical protein